MIFTIASISDNKPQSSPKHVCIVRSSKWAFQPDQPNCDGCLANHDDTASLSSRSLVAPDHILALTSLNTFLGFLELAHRNQIIDYTSALAFEACEDSRDTAGQGPARRRQSCLAPTVDVVLASAPWQHTSQVYQLDTHTRDAWCRIFHLK